MRRVEDTSTVNLDYNESDCNEYLSITKSSYGIDHF